MEKLSSGSVFNVRAGWWNETESTIFALMEVVGPRALRVTWVCMEIREEGPQTSGGNGALLFDSLSAVRHSPEDKRKRLGLLRVVS